MSAAESVRLICPNLQCRSILAVPPKARGKTVKCASCGARIRIPEKRAVDQNQAEATEAAAPDAES